MRKMRICRNRILNSEIRKHEISVNYWMSMRNRADSLMDKELATQNIWMKRNAIRRIEKLKKK